jgi:hypothetical protein
MSIISSYDKWDAYMARTCNCDPGFSGPSCADRICPRGDDPLTKDNAHNHIQSVDIFSTVTTITATNLAGTFTLTYTDVNGEAYTTSDIAVKPYDAYSSATAVGTATKAALEALPNNAIPSVSVTATYCEESYIHDVGSTTNADGALTVDAGGTALATPGVPAFYRPIQIATGDLSVIQSSDGKVAVQGDAIAVDSVATGVTFGAATGQITTLTNPYCMRLLIEFTGVPGVVNNLVVDHSKVTFAGKTNTQDSNSAVNSAVTSERLIGTGTLSYTRPSTVTRSDSSAGVISSKTLTITGVTAAEFPAGSEIQIECGTRNLGKYTVASDSTTDTIVVSETIQTNTCTSTGTALKATLLTHIIKSDLPVHNFGNIVGSQVKLGSTSVLGLVTATSGSTSGTFAHYIFVSVGNSGDISSASQTLKIDGTGTTENNECSDRGLCDRETGLCRCFAGYSGDSCETQKSIAA